MSRWALAGALLGFWANAAFFPGTAPKQPIEFSHKIHAGDNEIPCLYCHAQARRSTVAGVPSVYKCVGCHRVIAKDRPQISKVMGYWENGEPIPWIKVHDLPDFVYFPHKRHVQAERRLSDLPRARRDHAARRAHRAVEDGLVSRLPQATAVENGLDCWTCHK